MAKDPDSRNVKWCWWEWAAYLILALRELMGRRYKTTSVEEFSNVTKEQAREFASKLSRVPMTLKRDDSKYSKRYVHLVTILGLWMKDNPDKAKTLHPLNMRKTLKELHGLIDCLMFSIEGTDWTLDEQLKDSQHFGIAASEEQIDLSPYWGPFINELREERGLPPLEDVELATVNVVDAAPVLEDVELDAAPVLKDVELDAAPVLEDVELDAAPAEEDKADKEAKARPKNNSLAPPPPTAQPITLDEPYGELFRKVILKAYRDDQTFSKFMDGLAAKANSDVIRAAAEHAAKEYMKGRFDYDEIEAKAVNACVHSTLHHLAEAEERMDLLEELLCANAKLTRADRVSVLCVAEDEAEASRIGKMLSMVVGLDVTSASREGTLGLDQYDMSAAQRNVASYDIVVASTDIQDERYLRMLGGLEAYGVVYVKIDTNDASARDRAIREVARAATPVKV